MRYFKKKKTFKPNAGLSALSVSKLIPKFFKCKKSSFHDSKTIVWM